MAENPDRSPLLRVDDDIGGLILRNWIQDRFRTAPQSWFDWLFKHIRLPEQGRFLELGSGPGDLWLKFRQRLPPGLRLVLSDYSVDVLSTGRRRGLSTARFNLLAADAHRLPFPAASFDICLANGLLDCLPQIDTTLTEVRRVLKPGGVFYAAAGGRGHLRELEMLTRPFLADFDYGGDTNRFGMENGAELMAPWFPGARLLRYRTDLVFPQAEPVLAYILSEPEARKNLQGDKLQALRVRIDELLAVQGEVRVTTEKGLFFCAAPPA